MIEQLDIKAERYIINRYISIPKLFDSIGIDYQVNSNIFCPFHHNTNTKAAHLYKDDDGYKIWCFSESRMYGAWDIYKRFMPNISTNILAKQIYNNLSEELQESLLQNIDIEQDIVNIPYLDYLKKFKKGDISYKELLNKIKDTY